MSEQNLARIEYLQKELRHNNYSAALILHPRSLFYYTGTAQPANLWVPMYGEPVLFTRRAHEYVKNQTSVKHVEQALTFGQMGQRLNELGVFPSTGSLVGIEQDVVPHSMIESFKRNFNSVEIINVTPFILKQRFIKDELEIEKIKKATALWELGHEAILENLQPGRTEYELAAAFEHAIRDAGGDGTVWFRRWDACLPGGGIVASGPNTWVVSGHAMTVTGIGLSHALPWGASKRKLERGDLVVVDYGVCYEGYHGDLARTYVVGKPSSEQSDLWQRLMNLHEGVMDQIKPGVTGEELFIYGEELAKKDGLIDYFMGVGHERGKYIGHGIGLEIDEWPVLGLGIKEPLPPGAVFTLEPKFMVPGKGGVMVEDDFLITSNGFERLNKLGHELFYVT